MTMKYLKAVVSLPYCTPEGRVVTRPGWDEDTSLFLDLPRDVTPRVPLNPTPDMVRRAVAVLMKPWMAYGFATPDGAAGMVAAVLTAVCRPALDIAPAFLFDACQQGSGKTKAALALGSLIEGNRVGVTPFSSASDDETRKRLVSGAIEGSRFACLDNVVGYMKSESMTAVLTSGKLSDRVLGQSRTVTPTIRALMTMTGNNASLSADLMRRTVAVRVDAGERPTQREFAFDPVAVALHQRQQIAEAACVIWRAFFNAGAPAAGSGTGGFDDWAKLCRDPVLWLQRSGLAAGLPWQLGDPAASLLGDPAEGDPDIEDHGDMLRGLWALSSGSVFKAVDAVDWWTLGERRGEDAARLFREAVCSMRRGERDAPSAKTLGRIFMNRRDRAVGGLKLLSSGSASCRAWRVVQGS